VTAATNPNVPAAHVEQPVSVPTSAEVKASFDPNERLAGEITRLATVTSGETEIQLVRHDWPDSDPVVAVGLKIDSEHVQIHSDDPNPMEAWRRLTELANAASAAAQQLLTMTATGTWK
jgi:hypothetical protein